MNAIDGSWLYLKLYLGHAWDRIDRLVVDVVPRVRDIDGIDSWFFLRYFDESGPHLRLRVKPAPGETERVRREFDELCRGTLRGVSQYAPSDYNSIIVASDAEPPPAFGGDLSVAVGDYEPEYEKFGGETGMPIAERLFQASSEIAYAVLAAEQNGAYSRKTLAPCLMDRTFRGFPPDEGAGRFWKQYGLYWMGGDTPAAEDWRDRFREKADELAADGVSVVADPADLPAEANAALDAWSAALAEAYEAYRAAGLLDTIPAGMLCFQFAHLMNNRLGFYALEESYLAGLLEHRDLAQAPA